jgi:signal peptide peptidase SppA
MNYPHLAARVFNTPLMIHAGKLQAILSALGPRFELAAPPRLEGVDPVEHMPHEMSEEERSLVIDSIYVIDIGGSLVNRGAYADGWSGLVSYEWIRNEMGAALADDKVRGVLLRMDSFGGEVSGAFDAADVIREARGKKPVWCSVDDYAFSAAYLLASQCERIYVTRTSGVGSIGVIAMHADWSQWEKNEGVKVTTVKAGARKDDFSPHKPLAKEALAWLQAEVDRDYEMFVDYVTWGRAGLDAGAVARTEAGLYVGQDGIDAGLADRVGTFAQAVAEMAAALGPRRSAKKVGGNSAATTKGEGGMPPIEEKTAEPNPAPAATQEQSAAPTVDAAAIERQRIAAVLALPEAEGRLTLARELALTPGMSAETAQRLLAATPIAAAAKQTPFEQAMAGQPNPKVGADAGDADDKQAEMALVQAILKS